MSLAGPQPDAVPRRIAAEGIGGHPKHHERVPRRDIPEVPRHRVGEATLPYSTVWKYQPAVFVLPMLAMIGNRRLEFASETRSACTYGHWTLRSS